MFCICLIDIAAIFRTWFVFHTKISLAQIGLKKVQSAKCFIPGVNGKSSELTMDFLLALFSGLGIVNDNIGFLDTENIQF